MRTSLLICCIFISVALADYYNVIGVPRDASPSVIKRAFRRKARQLHPDKNKNKDDPEVKRKFQELNEAYEILSDAEKRRRYDQLGDAAFKQQEKGGGGGGGARHGGHHFNFQNFGFGGGGGFESFFNFGGQQHGGGGRARRRQGPLFSGADTKVVKLSQETHMELVENTLRPWFVMYYSEGCSHCHDAAPVFERVAAKLHNIVNVGAVNCGESPSTCASLDGYPTFVLYSGDEEHTPRAVQDGMEYSGARKEIPMLRFCVNNVPTNVDSISSFSDFEDAIIKQREFLKVPTVILVSKKKAVSPLFGAISRDFADEFDFVFVSAAKSGASQRKLLEHLEVGPDDALPIMMVRNYVIPGARTQRWGHEKGRKLDYDRMSEILSSYSRAMEQLQKAGGQKKRSYENSNVAAVDAATMDEVCPPRGGVLCVLALSGTGAEPPMEELAERFLKDRFRFARAEEDVADQFRLRLGIGVDEPALIVWNAKRSKAALFPLGEDFSKSRLFLDGILGGSGTWSRLDFSVEDDFQVEDE